MTEGERRQRAIQQAADAGGMLCRCGALGTVAIEVHSLLLPDVVIRCGACSTPLLGFDPYANGQGYAMLSGMKGQGRGHAAESEALGPRWGTAAGNAEGTD